MALDLVSRHAHGRIRDPAVAVGAVAAGWCVATLAFVLIHAGVGGLTFAGPYAGYFPSDQLRYLAWIREAGLHGLIADPFRAGASHIYLQPLFLISGLLWRAGLSVQAAYLVWTPIALAMLVWGYAKFAGRFLSGRDRAVALALALLYFSPLVPLFDYGGVVNANGAYHLVIAAGHGAAYWQAWGYLPTVVALGLMPLFVLGCASMLDRGRDRSDVARVALAGLLVAWLHPWGGIELVVIAFGMLALRGWPPGSRQVAIAALATALPLIYYAVIGDADSAWSLSQLQSGSGEQPFGWPLLVAYGPLLLAAVPALRRQRDPLLILWPLVALAVYVALGSGAREAALEGVTLPLSILAVRGWTRRSRSPALAFAVLLLAIVPGAFYSAHTFHDTFDDRAVPFELSRGEQRAVDAIEHARGGVLATPYLAPALPALAGLLDGQVTVGSDALFDGHVGPVAARRVIGAAGIRVVISDCLPGRAGLSRLLVPLGFTSRSYGCARVYRRG
jgi:hypothetical protein